jgi:hypothetical protein
MPVILFAAALDDLFADVNIARDAIYRAGGTVTSPPVRVVIRQPDRVGDFGETRIAVETTRFDLRVAAPTEGDTINVDGIVHVV